jgi:hypothetical protein
MADIYAQNGPAPPTLQPPAFLQNAIGALNTYGNGGQQPGMYPPGFNPRAIPQPDPTSFGNTERADTAQPYQPYTPGPFDFQGSNQGVAGQTGYDIAKGISEIPGVGGALNYASNAVARGPLLTAAGMNPDVNAAVAGGAEPKQVLADYWQRASENAAMGAVGGLENAGAKAAARLITTAEGGVADAGLLTRALQTAAGTEGVPISQHPVFTEYSAKGKFGPTNPRAHGGDIGTATRAVMAGDEDALKLLGDDLSNQLIQNKVADMMRRSGAPEDVVRRGLAITIASDGAKAAEASAQDVVKAGEALTPPPATTIADTNVAAVRDAIQNPSTLGEVRITGGGKVIDTGAVGADRDASLKAMGVQSDPIQGVVNEFNNLLPTAADPDLLARRAEGRIFTLQSQDPRLMSDTALSRAKDAIAEMKQRAAGDHSPTAPATAEYVPVPGEAPPFNASSAEQKAWLDKHLSDKYQAEQAAGGGGGAEKPPTGTGAPEPPKGPKQTGREVAQTLASQAMYLFTDAQRAALIVGHLPLLRQALPMMADAVARGQPQEIALALGRTVQGLVSEGRFNQMSQGFVDSLESAGIRGGDRLIAQLHGPVSATEEFGLRSVLGNIPVVSNLNRMYPTMLNSLRTGAALHLAEMQKLALGRVDPEKVITAVNELSGRGDLPGGPKAAEGLSNVFFGPKLLSATWQVPAKAIQSAGRIASTIPGNAKDFILHDGTLAGKPIDPVDLFRVRSLTAYVAAGVGLMKLGQSFGLQIVTDPYDRDFGRMILPGGARIDLWSGFGTEARLIAQEWHTFQQHDLPTNLGGEGRPRGPLDESGGDLAIRYLRGKLNPGAATVIGDYVFGKTLADKPPSLDPLIPQAPLSIGAGLTSDPGNEPTVKGEQPPQGAPTFDIVKALLAEAGAGVIPTPRKVVYDGLGAAMGEPTYGSGSILQTYSQLALASQGSTTPWHGGDPVMAAPATTIGTGANTIQLDPNTADRYVRAVGQARDAALGPLVNSPEFQQLSTGEQQKRFDAAREKADHDATVKFLAADIVHETDPKVVVAEAIDNLTKQTNTKDKAYWVATLDRAGKLTPDVKAAIDSLKEVPPGEKQPFTADEYVKAAPRVHEYLAHVPYGTDARPFGTSADWVAVDEARQQQSAREDALVRGGINPTLAKQQAEMEVLRSLPPIQQQLLHNGALLENPARRLMTKQYGSLLTRFLGPKPNTYQESDSAYRNFP